MKKKKSNTHKKKSAATHAFIRVFVLLGCILFVLGASYLFKKNYEVCANSISCIKDLSGKYNGQEVQGQFMGKIVSIPPLLASSDSLPVLGESTRSNKHIYIDLSAQHLYAKEGDAIIHEFPISSGLWGKTPTGDFKIWIKLRYTRMKGGNKAIGTFYDLPNVPYTMYFYNDQIPKWRGYGIHGAYWHNNFGHPMSHGCINVSTENSEVLYNWAEPPAKGGSTTVADTDVSTPITIYGTAPNQ